MPQVPDGSERMFVVRFKGLQCVVVLLDKYGKYYKMDCAVLNGSKDGKNDPVADEIDKKEFVKYLRQVKKDWGLPVKQYKAYGNLKY